MKLIFYMADLGKKWNLMSFHIFSGSLIVVDIVWMIASPGCVGSPSSRWQSNTWIIGFQNNFSPNLARTFEFFTPDAIHPSHHLMCRVYDFWSTSPTKPRSLMWATMQENDGSTLLDPYRAPEKLSSGKSQWCMDTHLGQPQVPLARSALAWNNLRGCVAQLPSSGFCKVNDGYGYCGDSSYGP